MEFKSINSEYYSFSNELNKTAKDFKQPSEQEISIAKSELRNELETNNTICYIKKDPLEIDTHLTHHARDFHKLLLPDSIVFTEISKIISRCRAINELLKEGYITTYPYNNQTRRLIHLTLILKFSDDDVTLNFRVEFDKDDIPTEYNIYFHKFKLLEQE